GSAHAAAAGHHLDERDDAQARPAMADTTPAGVRDRDTRRVALLLAGQERCARAARLRGHSRHPARLPRCAALARAATGYIEVRICHNSGKNLSSSVFARKDTPLDPPVPRLYPMMRSTVFRWWQRQS